MIESEFNFLGYKVSEIRCSIADHFGKTPEQIHQNINIENNFSEKEKRFVEVVLNINIESESKSFSFFIKIKGGFKASETMDEELFKKLSQQNGPAIMFPFARSIVATYTAQANIPPIILPIINFVIDKK